MGNMVGRNCSNYQRVIIMFYIRNKCTTSWCPFCNPIQGHGHLITQLIQCPNKTPLFARTEKFEKSVSKSESNKTKINKIHSLNTKERRNNRWR